MIADTDHRSLPWQIFWMNHIIFNVKPLRYVSSKDLTGFENEFTLFFKVTCGSVLFNGLYIFFTLPRALRSTVRPGRLGIIFMFINLLYHSLLKNAAPINYISIL